MRSAILTALAGLVLVGTAAAGELYEKLDTDPSTSRALREGRKILDDWLEADEELRKPNPRRPAALEEQREEAKQEFAAWLQGSKEALGVDLNAHPEVVLELIDSARTDYLNRRYSRGRIDFVQVDDPRGMDRLEYALFAPKDYNYKQMQRWPAVISMHGRVVDIKHPAFRGNTKRFLEKGRQVLHDYWSESPMAEKFITVAPTGLTDGFKFDEKRHFDDLQTLFRTLGELMMNYRADWNRVFLEVYGEAFRVCCEQPFLFAGFVVRERVDDRLSPLIPPEHFFMLENLNGTPLVYVADEENWDKVGKPLAEALEAAYTEAKALPNLLIVKGRRDANGALKGDEAKINEFLLKQRRQARKEFVWRYFRSEMDSPLPVQLTAINFSYGDSKEVRDAPLSAKAGKMNFKAATDYYEDEEGNKQPYNRVVINATEAEGAFLYLMPGFVDFGLPLTVVVNGKTLIDREPIERDWELFWQATMPRRFFMMPILGRRELAFEPVPQFVLPEKEKPAEDQPAEGEGTADGTDGADGTEKTADASAAAGGE